MGHICLAISITFLISPQYHSVKRVVQEAGQPKYSKFQYQTKLCKKLEILGSGNNNISQTQSESGCVTELHTVAGHR